MGTPPELGLSEKRPQAPVVDFTEPVPPSPSTYLLDLLQAPLVDNGKDNDLSYTSHMFLEDDAIDNNLLYQYPNHPAAALLTAGAEQPLVGQISTSHGTSDGLTTRPCNSVQNTPLQLSSVVATPEYYSYCDI